ncbi:hypothetical protein EYS14_19500 [Alteromonadaceae bacterium M269]|nr:hypothetical protein EYS14_19500 [Alteromonadaceae bacterium M269]
MSTSDDQMQGILMGNVKAYAEVAEPEAKGFNYSGVLTPAMMEHCQHYQFCLRNLNHTDGTTTSGVLTGQETNRITGHSNEGGYGLPLMPLYNVQITAATNNKDAAVATTSKDVLQTLREALIPIGVTVWLATDSAEAIDLTNLKSELFEAGYSVGEIGKSATPAPTATTNNSVLETVYCPFTPPEANSKVKTVTIGANSGMCQIYWAKQGKHYYE